MSKEETNEDVAITLASVKDYEIHDGEFNFGDVYYDRKDKVCRQVCEIFSNDLSATAKGLKDIDGYDEDGEHNMDSSDEYEGTERYLLLFRNEQGLYSYTVQRVLQDLQYEDVSVVTLWASLMKNKK